MDFFIEQWSVSFFNELITTLSQPADPLIQKTLSAFKEVINNYIAHNSENEIIVKMTLLTEIQKITQSLCDMGDIHSSEVISTALAKLNEQLHDKRVMETRRIFNTIEQAIENNELDSVREMLDQAMNSQQTELLQDLLRYFLETDEENEAIAFINLLAEKNFNFNLYIDGDMTPCIIACDTDNPQNKLAALITAGVDINQVSLKGGISPLSCACDNRDTDIITYLLQQGADASYIHTKILFKIAKGVWPPKYDFYGAEYIDGKTRHRRDLKTMHLLINKGVPVNQHFEGKNGKSHSLLQGALRGGYYPMVKLLLDAGAITYENMMEDAIKGGNVKMVSILLKELKNSHITLPQNIPSDLDLGMFQACFENGLGLANYNVTDYAVQNTPEAFLYCIRRGDCLISESRIEPYNQPTIHRVYESNDVVCQSLPLPQYLAVYGYGKNESLAHVIEAYDDVDIKDANESTLLHYAAAQCNIETVTLLILAGADVNARNVSGDTPLHCLIAGTQYEPRKQKQARACAEVLIYNGAKVNIQNNLGKEPLDYNRSQLWRDTLIAIAPRDKNIPISVTATGVATLFSITASQLAIHPQLASNLAHRKALPLHLATQAEQLSLMLLAPPKYSNAKEAADQEDNVEDYRDYLQF